MEKRKYCFGNYGKYYSVLLPIIKRFQNIMVKII